MRVLQTLALPLGYVTKQEMEQAIAPFSFAERATVSADGARKMKWSGRRGSNSLPPPWQGGALPNELNPQNWCLRAELNHRHGDFQSPALPTELQRHIEEGESGDPNGARTHDL